ncbi:MAG: DUF4215 domain-containing protein [Nannocystaceae bacterium]
MVAATSCTEQNPYLGRCGNGVLEPENAEECDDGAANGDDRACTEVCRIAVCGDGLLYSGAEECDLGDANADAGGCTSECLIRSCGDGIVQPGEACDDGPDNRATPDGVARCSLDCQPLPVCGNGIVEVGEACDDGNSVETDACRSTCAAASCGDGVTWAGVEACDDGDDDDGDACLSTCAAAVCGDGVVWEGVEACDDGNDDNHDGCLNDCTQATCGDGLVHAGVEECEPTGDAPDPCNAQCMRDRLVFVTKTYVGADFGDGPGALAFADGLCADEAEAAGLPRAERFKAWLSAEVGGQFVAPATRFSTRSARYVAPSGTRVADDWASLTSGALVNGIEEASDGAPQGYMLVWTGTTPAGTADESEFLCANWTSADDSLDTFVGSTVLTDAWWTALPDPFGCGGLGHFYCFED